MTIKFVNTRPRSFKKIYEKDLVTLQADIGETFINRVTGFRHPYKTGRLRASWRVEDNLSFTDVAPQGAVPNQFNVYPTGRVEVAPYTVSYVTNGVPYGGLVDQGIGISYARNFVRPALKYTARQFR